MIFQWFAIATKGAQWYWLPLRGSHLRYWLPPAGESFCVLPVVVVDSISFPSSWGYPRQGGIRKVLVDSENLDFFYILIFSPIFSKSLFFTTYVMTKDMISRQNNMEEGNGTYIVSTQNYHVIPNIVFTRFQEFIQIIHSSKRQQVACFK